MPLLLRLPLTENIKGENDIQIAYQIEDLAEALDFKTFKNKLVLFTSTVHPAGIGIESGLLGWLPHPRTAVAAQQTQQQHNKHNNSTTTPSSNGVIYYHDNNDDDDDDDDTMQGRNE